ncbi:transposase [Pseudotabrizicola sp.]|uniref:IS110 family transposase n=1 Tax=Pseudotabrizicola sp. TaxID=2939647 RepID=UPI00351F70A0
MTNFNIGVDISKSHLDVFRLEDGAAQRFDNSAAGFRDLARWLGKSPVARVVFERTGAYHTAFEAKLGVTFPLVKVNPLQARRFAEAHGTRAKTDAVDARILARMGAAFDLEVQADGETGGGRVPLLRLMVRQSNCSSSLRTDPARCCETEE